MSSSGAGRYYSASPYAEDTSGDGLSGLRSDGREPGTRRKKLAGYLKAANELRQAYQQSYTSGWRSGGGDRLDWAEGDETPGAFPDAAIVRSGDEEMVLFPSYARNHVKHKPQQMPATTQDSLGNRDVSGANDAQFWKKEWEKYEDDNAVVDVDVRGWIYYPHKGQMTRKHRLFVGLARQLVGLPAPSAKTSGPNSRDSSPHKSHGDKAQERNARQEEELVEKEALSILKKGEAEAAKAEKGGYSETPSKGSDNDSIHTSRSRDASPAMDPRGRGELTPGDEEPPITGIQKRASWTQPAHMSSAELSMANSHLMARLRPFLSNPLANTPISIFFYNDEISRQRTIYTDAYGHFSIRAALEFVPTHIRVIVSETLSTTAEVHVTDPKGVSLISDIDDTIKHSAISSGAREIFRNAFIRELGDLTIEGVREWYDALSDRGVKFHYVSNSPWQLYPAIYQFFKTAGLPPGSFHLKQYSGMLQGIFEPVAERKKATLDRLARDFPERSFILVGDSGEADLEVYTDFVLENPGRVLGVFIRDVTTSVPKGFFDNSMGPLSGSKASKSKPKATNGSRSARSSKAWEEDDPELRAAIAASLRDFEEPGGRFSVSASTPAHSRSNSEGETAEQRPRLPPRRPTEPPAPEAQRMKPPMGDLLIDFSDDDDATSTVSAPCSQLTRATSDTTTETLLEPIAEAPLQRSNAIRVRGSPNPGHRDSPPVIPKKPMALRSCSQENVPSTIPPVSPYLSKPPPPPIRRPSTTVRANKSRSTSPLSHPPLVSEPTSGPAPSQDQASQPGYAASAKNKLAQTYNSLPSTASLWNGTNGAINGARATSTTSSPPSKDPAKKAPPPPPPPPRRTGTSYVDTAKDMVNNRIPSLYNTNGDPNRRPATANASTSSASSKMTSNSQATTGAGSTFGATNGSAGGGGTGNKREELWRKRLARAQQILDDKGVILRTWRIGSDVMDEAIKLVDDTHRKHERTRSDSKGNELVLRREKRIDAGLQR